MSPTALTAWRVPAQIPSDEPRRLTAWLLLAILALPVPFVFLLLRKGYSRDIRIGGFLFAFTIPALHLLALLWTVLTGAEAP